MGVPTLEVSYTSATTGRGDHEVHKGHVAAFEKKIYVHLVGIYEELDMRMNGTQQPVNLNVQHVPIAVHIQ
jgi:hypothetical protein